MFQKSGMSIAMGNASPEVQAEAGFVTASKEKEEEGFGQAVDAFVLRRRLSCERGRIACV